MDHENRWIELDRLVADEGFDMPAASMAELASRLREAIEDKDPAEGRALAAQLADVVRLLFARALPEARAAASGASGQAATPARQAYLLAQLGFAYQVLAELADRRTDATFEEVLRNETFARYARALLEEDLSGTQLAELLDQRPETVSRNLKVLKEIGAIDARRKQTSFINFLTPAARTVLGQSKNTPIRSRCLAAPVRKRLQSEGIDPLWCEPQNFGQSAESDRREAALADD